MDIKRIVYVTYRINVIRTYAKLPMLESLEIPYCQGHLVATIF